MELSQIESFDLINKRLNEHPEIKNLIADSDFKKKLSLILEYIGIDSLYFDDIEFELYVVLAFYAPIGHLAKNITETTGISITQSERLVLMIKTVLFSSIENILNDFEIWWNSEGGEGVQPTYADRTETPAPEPLLKPSYSATPTEEEKGGSGPLTRDDLIKALSTKRTMATDIENLSKETTPTPPTGN